MTSTTGTGEHPTGEHPEVSEISDLTDGLLSPSRSADVREHLAGCPLCDDVYASLEEIRALLGTLPGPLRMPADVAGRIDAALAAEALLDATAPSGAVAVSRETATSPSLFHVKPTSCPAGPRRPPGRPGGPGARPGRVASHPAGARPVHGAGPGFCSVALRLRRSSASAACSSRTQPSTAPRRKVLTGPPSLPKRPRIVRPA